MHYLLMLYFWSHGHVVRLDIQTQDYKTCVATAKQVSQNIATTWVCIPDSE